jgi:hypothetical protein
MVLLSCKKSNNPTPAPDANKVIKERVLGKWKLVDQVFTYYDKSGKQIKTGTLEAEIDQRWV